MRNKSKIGIALIIISSLIVIPCINLLLYANAEIQEGFSYMSYLYFFILLLCVPIFILFLIGIYLIIQIEPLLKKKGMFLIIFGFFIVCWFILLTWAFDPFPPIFHILYSLILGLVIGSSFYIPGFFYANNYKKLNNEDYGTKKNLLGSIFASIGILIIVIFVNMLIAYWFTILNFIDIYLLWQSLFFLILGITCIYIGIKTNKRK